MRNLVLCACLLLITLYFVSTALACNKNVCASLVSKCLLLRSCECDMTDKKNCTCCRQCHKCLARLYTECCSCVGMCPDHSEPNDWLKSSTVEELQDPLPELFEVLTEEEDIYLRWTTFNYPAHLDLLYFKPLDLGDFALNVASNLPPDQPVGEEVVVQEEQAAVVEDVKETEEAEEKEEEEHLVRHGGHRIALDPASRGRNCTVAYMTPCLSLSRCRAACASMGAARYRWFHAHGCCECIGSTCLDFGKGEPHCLKCPDAETGRAVEESEYYYEDEEEEEEAQKYDGEEEGQPVYHYDDDDDDADDDYDDDDNDDDEVEEGKYKEDVEAEINGYLNGYIVATGEWNDVDHEARKVGGLN